MIGDTGKIFVAYKRMVYKPGREDAVADQQFRLWCEFVRYIVVDDEQVAFGHAVLTAADPVSALPRCDIGYLNKIMGMQLDRILERNLADKNRFMTFKDFFVQIKRKLLIHKEHPHHDGNIPPCKKKQAVLKCLQMIQGGLLMNTRERENATLSFEKPEGRGAVEETFYPWNLTVERFGQEGVPAQIIRKMIDITNDSVETGDNLEKYLNVKWSEGVFEFEKHLGFDPVRRIALTLPFRHLDDDSISYLPISCTEDWAKLKESASQELERYFTAENIRKVFGPLQAGHERGDYSIRMHIEGFFWAPRELMGIEPHLYAFFDVPDLMHDINEFVLQIYLEKLTMILDILPVDVLYIMEDLSGKTGPMISPELFDEFVGSYYKRLIPVLKQKGVRHVFVDTDGDFRRLIPNFIEAGVEGFLPMDVNAGMDIVAVRQEFPRLKFIGAFNKLCIADGPAAIDQEFARILPVIRQGGYIPGADHQVAPSTSLENYLYYIRRLKEVMEQAGLFN